MRKKIKKFLVVLGLISLVGTGVTLAQNQTNLENGTKNYKMESKRYNLRQDIDPAKLEAFCKEIQPQWQKLWQTKNELRELYSKKPPDWAAIEKKEQELIRIRLEIQKKAYEKGLPYEARGGLRLRRICGW